MKIKHVWTFSPEESKVRMVRLLWGQMDGNFSKSLSISLIFRPRIFDFVSQCNGWYLNILGVQIHLKTATYGAFVLR
jgi:hypothetical protein